MGGVTHGDKRTSGLWLNHALEQRLRSSSGTSKQRLMIDAQQVHDHERQVLAQPGAIGVEAPCSRPGSIVCSVTECRR